MSMVKIDPVLLEEIKRRKISRKQRQTNSDQKSLLKPKT